MVEAVSTKESSVEFEGGIVDAPKVASAKVVPETAETSDDVTDRCEDWIRATPGVTGGGSQVDVSFPDE